MRLGAHFYKANKIEELEPVCEKLDELGLSAIPAPVKFWTWEDDDCIAFGEKAKGLGLVIGEAGCWKNMIDPDKEAVAQHIEMISQMLVKGDLMGLRGVVSLVGSHNPEHSLSPHPFNFTDEARAEYREVCLRILDGLELETTKYMTEPWCNTFYYRPVDILEFLLSVDHPNLGLHMDMMNMIHQDTYFKTGEVINRAFDLLSDFVVSVHAKDLRWDYRHLMIKIDEVAAGEGVMDYETFLSRLDELDPNMPVYTEHWKTEEQWLHGIDCLHKMAEKYGRKFLRRGEKGS